MGSGSAASIWKRFCVVGGITTELLGVNATTGRPQLQVVVFPGNPGSAAYFKSFMLSVHEQLCGVADVLAITHAGHDTETDHGGRLWDLSQQIEHKVAFLREHVLLAGRPPVLLVGHSIGAAMMVKAVAQVEGLAGCVFGGGGGELGSNPLAATPATPFEAAAAAAGFGSGSESGSEALPPIVKLVAVFPFFETNFPGNFRQRRLRAIAPWYEVLGWVGAAVTSLPLALRLAFVRLNAAMDPDAVHLTSQLLARHTVRNAFFLASHEFKDLSQPWDWALLRSYGTRLHVMGCAEDTWMSRTQYDEMLQRVPGLQATWHPDLRHAFCTCGRQSAEVARTIADIAQSIPSLPPRPSGPKWAQVQVHGLVQEQEQERARSWGSRVGSVSAISVSRAGSDSTSSLTTATTTTTTSAGSASATTTTSAGSASASDGDGSGGECWPGAAPTTAAGDGLCSAPRLAQHTAHNDQQVPYGQTTEQRRQLYGDDVTEGHRRGAPAAAANVGGGAAAAIDVNGWADQSAVGGARHHRHRAHTGTNDAAEEYGSKQGQPAAATAPQIALVATSGAGSPTTRGLARRPGATQGGRT